MNSHFAEHQGDLRLSLILNSLLAVIVAVMLGAYVPPIWAPVVLALNFMRIAADTTLSSRIGLTDLLRIHAGFAFVSGLAWSYPALHIPLEGSIPGLFLAFMVACVAATEAVRTSIYAPGVLAFALAIQVHFTMHLAWRADDFSKMAVIVAIGSSILLFYAAIRGERQFRKALSNSEETLASARIARIFDEALRNSPLSMYVLDRNLVVRTINPAFTRVFGYSAEEAIGRTASDFLPHPDFKAQADRSLRCMFEQRTAQSNRAELVGVRKDGTHFHYRAFRTFIPDANDAAQDVIVVQVEDIEELWRKDQELRWLVARYEVASAAAGVGDFVWEPQSGDDDWSPALYTILGYEKTTVEPSETAFLARVHADDLPMVEATRDMLREQPRLSEPHWSTYRLALPGGQIRHVRQVLDNFSVAEGGAIAVIGAVTDITLEIETADRLKAEQEHAARALARAELVIEAAKIGVFEYDPRTDKMWRDDRMHEIYGVDPASFPNDVEAWSALIHPDDLAHVMEVLDAFREVTNNTKFVSVRHRLVRPSGEVRYVYMNIKGLFDDKSGDYYICGSVWDETEQIQHAEALRAAKEMAQITIESANDGILRTDAHGIVTLCNAQAESLLGVTAEDITGKSLSTIIEPLGKEAVENILNPMRQVLAVGKTYRAEKAFRLCSGSGRFVYIAPSIAPLHRQADKTAGAVAVLHDQTRIALMTEELNRRANTDHLTGLLNRRAFEEALDAQLHEHNGQSGYLLCIDLDHFKTINDLCGHAAGDRLLREVSQLFCAGTREVDKVARLGGDEFAILLDCDAESVAVRMAESIVSAVGSYRLRHDGQSYRVGVSVGVCALASGMTISQALAAADAACYSAKYMGRGRYEIYRHDNSTIENIKMGHNWFQRLENALENNHFSIFLQKIVDGDRKAVGFEALLRLADEGQFLSPHAFMPQARAHGLLPKIDKWVAENTIATIAGEMEKGCPFEDCYISVNLNASSLADPKFNSWLIRKIEENVQICPHLWIEVTETDEYTAGIAELDALNRLRRLGVRLYLDDFGTGYNSFGVLKHITVDGIKIDRTVTRGVDGDPVDQALVSASLFIAKTHRLELVAEGVEDEQTFARLKALGVSKFQGFLFHEPAPAWKAIATMRASFPAARGKVG
ncbi:EAL domain-containing protein [Pelagibacterium halotolerans]|uniref:bifunctional diguanylate cyclase/phosphodiesterase n=1 Tax=Pelagibacterium halotolerans TaxID=531813 RepID=UPI003850254E